VRTAVTSVHGSFGRSKRWVNEAATGREDRRCCEPTRRRGPLYPSFEAQLSKLAHERESALWAPPFEELLSKSSHTTHCFINPSFEEGSLRPSKKCNATLNRAQRGRSEALLQQWSALPSCARPKVAFHLFDGRSCLPEGGAKKDGLTRPPRSDTRRRPRQAWIPATTSSPIWTDGPFEEGPIRRSLVRGLI